MKQPAFPSAFVPLAVAVLLCWPSVQRLHADDAATVAPKPAPAAHVDAAAKFIFERDIRPILRAHCFDCHGGGAKPKGGLDLRLRRLLEKGGESGPVLQPGKADDSLLYQRVRDHEMPPGDVKLTDAEVAAIAGWIADGAPTARPEPESIGTGIGITPEDREFWSLQPLRRPTVPDVGHSDRVRTQIDVFLLAQMQQHGLAFSNDADKVTLIRRATIDLTGLPPTPEEVEQFVNDPTPDAYERLIDRLLASPHYGERWGRHWLDVAGYADSEGNLNADTPRPYAYKFRDYVVRALNADKPLDRFIQEQLAGDELVPSPYTNLAPDAIDTLAATGFLRMAADGTGSDGVNQDAARNQVIADTIRIVSSSLLGLTVGCAQCHNHRYDPIPQEDYYRLRAILEPAYNWKNWRGADARRISLYTDADRAKAAEINARAGQLAADRDKLQQKYIHDALEKELQKFDEALRNKLRDAFNAPADKRTDEQKQLLKKNPSVNIDGGNLYQYNPQAADEIKGINARVEAVQAQRPVEDFVAVLTEVPGQLPETFVFHRGDPGQPTQKVTPAALSVEAPDNARFQIADHDAALPTSGRRLAYARWLTNGTHPLVTRVLVNRVWMHHFGKGIVDSPADFGRMGSRPTHPELLDWLATEFVAQGWSLKRLHKLIMTSTAYRQSSARSNAGDSIDADNRLYWRKPVVRMEAEDIRDGILAASGALTATMYGAPVPVKEDAVGQIVVGIDNKSSSNRPGAEVPLGGEGFRRSIYIQVRRSQPLGFLHTFDSPVMLVNCEKRVSSTASTQSLLLMNNEFILEQSQVLAYRLNKEAPGNRRTQTALAWKLVFSRPAADQELERAVAFMEKQAAFQRSQAGNQQPNPIDADFQALVNLCQVLLSANEFLYLD